MVGHNEWPLGHAQLGRSKAGQFWFKCTPSPGWVFLPAILFKKIIVAYLVCSLLG